MIDTIYTAKDHKIESCLLHSSIVCEQTFELGLDDDYFKGVKYGLCNSCIRHRETLQDVIDTEITNRVRQLKRSNNV